MPKVVHKWRLKISDEDQVLAGLGDIVMVDVQDRSICIWAEVNEYAEPRTFRVFGTGHEIPDSGDHYYSHVGSCLDAPCVWHVYEKFKARTAQWAR